MRAVLVGTAGHIDHGKSSLVRALTGTDPDRLPEEKARGITIDLGFAHAAWDGVTYSFVDVPGHEKFVRTMVAGAHGIDVALLVIAADDAVMPQTREHLAILSLLGVSSGVVARTKSDLVDEESGSLVDDEVRELTRGTFLESAPVVAVSSTTGLGLDALRAALTKAAFAVPERAATGIPRLPIDRAFSIKGFGPVVTGTLRGGPVRPEDRLVLHPSGREVRVKRVEVHGSERTEALPGERTSLNLAGVDRADLGRGATLTSPGLVEPASVLTCEIEILPAAGGPLRHGAALRVHHGTAEVSARLSLLVPAGTSAIPALAPGSRATVQLLLAEPLVALRGERLVLRRPSPAETLGGGRILDPGRARWRRRDAASSALRTALETLANGDDVAVASLLVREAGPAGLDAAALSRRLGVLPARGEALLRDFLARGDGLRLTPARVVASRALNEMAERAAALFASRKTEGAPSPLVPRGEFLEKLGRGLPPDGATGWLALLAAAKLLVLDGDLVGPPGTKAGELTGASATHADRIADAYRAAGFEPPRTFELTKSLGIKPNIVEGLVAHLAKQGIFVRLSPEIVVHRDTVDGALAKLTGVKGRTMGIAEFRDLLGLSRKTLIPLLEHFDRVKRTIRKGDVRVVL